MNTERPGARVTYTPLGESCNFCTAPAGRLFTIDSDDQLRHMSVRCCERCMMAIRRYSIPRSLGWKGKRDDPLPGARLVTPGKK